MKGEVVERPVPTRLYHFTHAANLPSIVGGGLRSHSMAEKDGLTKVDIGNRSIKAGRAGREVPVRPNGVVGDYVPFYFAPRSPMMSAIDHGRVPEYTSGSAELVYLATTLEDLVAAGAEVLLTDRNAALTFAEFHRVADGEAPDDFVDWQLMKEQYWNNTEEYPDRKERRMAECLVHGSVPWEAIRFVGARSETVAGAAARIIESAGWQTRAEMRRDWYF